jgi:excisionase family DNA binding protein
MLHVSVGHLYRLVDEGVIHQYRPEGSHQLFWIPELQAYDGRRRARA